MPEQPHKLPQKDSLDESALLFNAGSGCRESFAELARRYSGRLYHFLRYKTHNEQDAEDLTQETLLRAYHNISSFDARAQFSTWLFTIAYRLMINYYKKFGGAIVVEELPDIIDHRQPELQLIESEETLNLWRLARRLKKDRYAVLWLRYVEELPVNEIARVLNKSSIHVRVLLHRARTELKYLFETRNLGLNENTFNHNSIPNNRNIQSGNPIEL